MKILAVQTKGEVSSKMRKKSRTEYIKNNMIWEIVYNAETTIFPFIIRTVIIKCLGSEYLGLNSLCTSVLSVLNLANLGVDSAFLYFMYDFYARGSTAEVNALLKFYRNINRVIGLVIFISGMALIPFLTVFASTDVPYSINIYIVFFLYLVNSCLSYETTFYEKLIFCASQRWDYHLKNLCLSSLVLYISQIFFIWQKQYYLSVLMMCVCTLLEAILVHRVFKKNYPGISCVGSTTVELKIKIRKKIGSVVVYRLRDSSRNSFDSVILSHYFGLIMLANYQNYVTILSIPSLLRAIFSHSVVNSLGNYLAVEGKENAYDLYKLILFVHLFLSGWFSICFYYLVNDFITIWLGSSYLLSSSISFFFAVYYYVMGFCETAQMMRSVTGAWEIGKTSAVIEAMSNLFLNIILAKYMGVGGIILATIITIIFIYVPCEMRAIVRGYFNKGYVESFSMVLKNCVWIMFNLICLHIADVFIPQTYFWRLIVKAGICVVIPLGTFWLWYFKSNEYNLILRMIKSILN